MPAASETVCLRNGLAVPLYVLRLLWSLEERDFSIGIADDGALLVSPKSRLTADDDRAIRAHRDELLAIVRSVETEQ